MGADTLAELSKLGKRPATWVLGMIFFAGVLVLGYATIYALAASLPETGETSGKAPYEARSGGVGEGEARAEGPPQAGSMREELLSGLLPENLLSGLLSTSSNLGGTLALILGALAVGGEYGWGTLKTVLTQRSGRTNVLLGKLIALGVVLVVFVLLAFVAAVAGSYGVALLEGVPADWPPPGELAGGTGAAWLILMTWAALGAFLAVLFGGTALAIGLGLVYVLVLEAVIAGLPADNEVFEAVRGALPGQRAGSLAGSFGPTASGAPGIPAPADPGQAALILGFYVVGFASLAALALRSRDVT